MASFPLLETLVLAVVAFTILAFLGWRSLAHLEVDDEEYDLDPDEDMDYMRKPRER